jgi:hypothetical protein
MEDVKTNEAVISVEDNVIMENMKKSMAYLDEMYIVQIPWTDGRPQLPNNFEMALRRLEGTEKRLMK